MKKTVGIVALIVAAMFFLVQVCDLQIFDMGDFLTTTYAETYLKTMKEKGFTTRKNCEFLLEFSKNIKIHEEIRGNYKYSVLDIFNQVERECEETIKSYQKSYQKTQKTNVFII